MSPQNMNMKSDIRHRPLELRLYPDATLREVAQPIKQFNSHVQRLAMDMLDLMHRHNGIGLAAPQVGLTLGLIVVDIGNGPLAIVNPMLIQVSERMDHMIEGCLSLPLVQIGIERQWIVEVKGKTPSGHNIHMQADGLLARVIQHEVDHLHGKLICDYANASSQHETFVRKDAT